MKKFHFLILILSLCLLFPSCTTVKDLPPDMVITPPDDASGTPDKGKEAQGGYRDMVHSSGMSMWNNLVFTSTGRVINFETKEVFPACTDPLCNHKGDACAFNILFTGGGMVISGTSTKNDLTLYLTRSELVDIVDDHTVTHNHQLLRYHFQTGEATILAENLPGPMGMTFRIDPQTDRIFLNQQTLNEAGENECYLYIYDGKTGKMNILTTSGIQAYARYALDDTVYFSASDGKSYCIDFSKKELALEETDMQTMEVYGGYYYYRENAVQERISVPDEMVPLCEQYERNPYSDFTKYDLYRINILQEDATPELVAQEISAYKISGNYVFCCGFAPQYVTSYFVSSGYNDRGIKQITYYQLGDPNIPENANMFNSFAEYCAPIQVMEVSSLEHVATISSEKYWCDPFSFRAIGNVVSVDWESREPEDYVTIMSGAQTVSSGYLYLNKSYLTDEDMVVFDLPNTRI